jgi:hypothetical protein
MTDNAAERDPDFLCAFEVGEVKMIGDKPENIDYDLGPSETAAASGEEVSLAQGVVARH